MHDEHWYEDESAREEDGYQITEYDITASPNDFNIKTLFDFIESGVVTIPGFQRHYVWDVKRASKLIESIIMGIPIPQIFLFEEARNKFLVIDGQQRLMSIYYFMIGRFPRKEKRTELRKLLNDSGGSGIPSDVLEDKSFFTDFRLSLPEHLPNRPNKLNKRTYSSLEEHKTTFELRTIRNIIIKQTFPTDDHSSIYEIFHRLNTGGMNLKAQEIRTSLYHSDFLTMLYRINAAPKWRRLTGLREADLHMKDIEFLLRGFALLSSGDEYAPSMAKFLNSFSNKCRALPTPEIDYYEKLFYSFVDACENLSDRVFFGKTSKFTISIYDAVFAAACKAAYQARGLVAKPIPPAKLEALKQDKEFVEASQSRTSSTRNVQVRLQKAAELLGD